MDVSLAAGRLYSNMNYKYVNPVGTPEYNKWLILSNMGNEPEFDNQK
jgi:hypothetical protein